MHVFQNLTLKRSASKKGVSTVLIWMLFLSFCFSVGEFSFAQEKRRMVILEVTSTPKAQIGTQQRWVEALQGVGADKVTSRTSIPDEPTAEETQLGAVTVITVTGFIGKEKLHLPGGSFSIRDKSGIRDLLQRLRDDGATVALADKKAFGLTSEQLVGLHGKLSKKLEFNTAGQKSGDVIKKIAGQTGLNFVYDRAAKVAMNGGETVLDELNGYSSGMALATVLRPLGLVLAPKREQGKALQIHILDSRSTKEHWPVGWPIERAPVAVVPKMSETLPINIKGFQMKAAMDAVQNRMGILFLYDQNTLAREGIELDEVRVTLVHKKISLGVCVSRLLRQSKPRMMDEIRVDENGKPFLWITVR